MSFFTTASALLALSSIASAIPQTGFYANSTSAAGNTTVSPFSNSTSTNTTANSLTENLFCPGLNAQVFSDARGVEYIIECNTNHFGVIIDIAINSTLFSRRQAIAQPSSLGDCLTLCDETSACVGTAFNTAARTCTLFSSVGAAYTDATTDFAVRISAAAGTPVASGASLTSTIFSTNVVTVQSCAPTVTNCPLKGAAAVITQVIPISSTVYECPAATVVPAAPVACNCAYSASTATIYSATVIGGVTTVVQAASSVIAVPYPTGTVMSTTTCAASAAVTTLATACSGCKTTGTATGSGGIVAFTGAADHLKAGMGMMAIVAGAAALL